MNAVLQNLLKLQAIEFAEPPDRTAESQALELRALIPQPILGHYDRLRVRGKKGVAFVRNQACTGCHMRLPIGVITVLMRGEDIQLCDSCGRYLCLQDGEQGESAVPATAAAPTDKPKAKRAVRRKTVASTT